MKKIISILVASIAIFAIPFTSFASDKSGTEIASNIVAVREDVSRNEAMSDSNFSLEKSMRCSSLIGMKAAVNWNTWGSSEKFTNGAKPVGYSEHKEGNTVLETYHYTRTYLGELMKSGDSGRIWGNYTVKATGSLCDYDVWGTSIHYVKYGTES